MEAAAQLGGHVDLVIVCDMVATIYQSLLIYTCASCNRIMCTLTVTVSPVISTEHHSLCCSCFIQTLNGVLQLLNKANSDKVLKVNLKPMQGQTLVKANLLLYLVL